MKKNNFKKILLILILSLFASLIGVLLINFNYFFSGKNNKQSFDYKFEKNIINNKVIINTKSKSNFVGKLVIKYHCEEDSDIIIKYIDKDYYGNDKFVELSEKLDNEVYESVNNIYKNVKDLTIEYDADKNVDINSISSLNKFKFNIYIFIYFFSFGMLISIFVLYRNKITDNNIHKFFMFFGLIIGLTFIIIQPNATFYSWDDQIHFMNTYEFFGGNHNWSVGEFSMIDNGQVGRDSIDSFEEQINQMNYLNNNKRSGYSTYTSHFFTISKVAYVAPAFGYHFSKFIGLPFSICFKIGKICILISYLFVMMLAIKTTKVGKRIISFIGLLPSVVFLACQYSYDSPVIAGLTLGFAVLFRWYSDDSFMVDFRTMLLFLFGILFACFTKAIYIPFILLFLFIPYSKFKNKSVARYLKVLLLLIFIMVLYTFVSSDSLSSNLGGDMRGGTTNAGEQLKLILSNPVGYFYVINDTFISQFFVKLVGYDSLGRYAYVGSLTNNIYYFVLLMLFFVALTDNKENILKNHQKILTIIVSIGIMLLIWTALYLSFTPVGLTTINGVQSRYFIPLLFPVLLCLQTPKIDCKFNYSKYNFVILLFIVLINEYLIYLLILKQFCM